MFLCQKSMYKKQIIYGKHGMPLYRQPVTEKHMHRQKSQTAQAECIFVTFTNRQTEA